MNSTTVTTTLLGGSSNKPAFEEEEAGDCEDEDDDPPTTFRISAKMKHKKKKILSYKIVMAIFFLYALSFTLIIPTLPMLLSVLSHGDAGLASIYMGVATSLRYTLEVKRREE